MPLLCVNEIVTKGCINGSFDRIRLKALHLSQRLAEDVGNFYTNGSNVKPYDSYPIDFNKYL